MRFRRNGYKIPVRSRMAVQSGPEGPTQSTNVRPWPVPARLVMSQS